MARNFHKSKKAEPPEGGAISNSAARKEIIQKAAAQIGHLDREIDGHKLQIKTIREDLKDIFAKLKDDLGLDRKFIEFTIKNLINPEEAVRNAIQDTIREVYEALHHGEQMDLLHIDDRLEAAAKKFVDGMGPGDSLSVGNKFVVGKDADGHVISDVSTEREPFPGAL
jgi:uncharacterized protein (UPF0335 family)